MKNYDVVELTNDEQLTVNGGSAIVIGIGACIFLLGAILVLVDE